MTIETPTAYDRIRADESYQPKRTGEPVRHELLFTAPDRAELLRLEAEGMMPVPAVGAAIDLHGVVVTVAAVDTSYGRGPDGGPDVISMVTVVDAASETGTAAG